MRITQMSAHLGAGAKGTDSWALPRALGCFASMVKLSLTPNLKTQKVDKENPDSWIKYTKSSCKSCAATCCTMPIEIRWEDLVRLKLVSADDLVQPINSIITRLKKEKVISAYRKESGLFAMKQTSDGKCRYLIDNRCSVYQSRPLVCRRFPTEAGWRHGFCPQKPTSV